MVDSVVWFHTGLCNLCKSWKHIQPLLEWYLPFRLFLSTHNGTTTTTAVQVFSTSVAAKKGTYLKYYVMMKETVMTKWPGGCFKSSKVCAELTLEKTWIRHLHLSREGRSANTSTERERKSVREREREMTTERKKEGKKKGRREEKRMKKKEGRKKESKKQQNKTKTKITNNVIWVTISHSDSTVLLTRLQSVIQTPQRLHAVFNHSEQCCYSAFTYSDLAVLLPCVRPFRHANAVTLPSAFQI